MKAHLEADELREDKARLDFLEGKNCYTWEFYTEPECRKFKHRSDNTIRQAIDKARKQSGNNPGVCQCCGKQCDPDEVICDRCERMNGGK